MTSVQKMSLGAGQARHRECEFECRVTYKPVRPRTKERYQRAVKVAGEEGESGVASSGRAAEEAALSSSAGLSPHSGTKLGAY